MIPDAHNENTSGVGSSETCGQSSPAPEEGVEPSMVQAEMASGITETITGNYSSLDDLHQRQDVSVCGNSIGTGAYKVSGGGFVNAYGDADLLASGQSRIYSWGQARVAASQNAMVVATDQVKVTASGNVAVCATGTAKVYASDDVTVAALDRTEIYASGRVKIKAFGNCTVYASGDSQVEVADPTTCAIFLYGNAKLKAVVQSN